LSGGNGHVHRQGDCGKRAQFHGNKLSPRSPFAARLWRQPRMLTIAANWFYCPVGFDFRSAGQLTITVSG
jgi:hypothetical protein